MRMKANFIFLLIISTTACTRQQSMQSIEKAFVGKNPESVQRRTLPKVADGSVEQQHPTPGYKACMDHRSAMSGYWGDVQCLSGEVDRQKAALNAEYKALSNETNSQQDMAALDKAQRAWIAFREVDCNVKGGAIERSGGNGGEEARLWCLLDHVMQRRRQIDGYWAIHVPDGVSG